MNDGVAVRDSSIEGKGVFAIEGFARGEPIQAIDDSRVVTDDNPLKDGEDEKYLDRPRDQVVLMQPPERHIDYSCEPNSYAKTIGDTRYLFAMREIARDEEITYDYRMDSRSDETGDCNCGTERCSGLVAWDFFALPRQRQLEYMPYLDSWFFEKYDDLLEETVLSEEATESSS